MKKRKKRSASKFYFVATTLVAFMLILFALYEFGGYENPLNGLEGVLGISPTDKTQELRVQIIDVGQGDSILVQCGEKSLLVDAGDNGSEQKIMNVLRSRGIQKLDYIVATHPHADHIGAMPEIINEFGASVLIMPKIPANLVPTSATFSAFLDAIENNCDKRVYSSVGHKYSLGTATFEIVAPISQNDEDLNENSVVIMLTYGNNSFLLTGDASEEEEKEIINSQYALDCDVLKVGHHGSSTSSSAMFLQKAKPEICVISCGADNRYGHPHSKTVKRLNNICKRLYRTDVSGDIVFTSDGTILKTFIDGKEVD